MSMGLRSVDQPMSENFSISVVGRDEPGIVAAIAKVLYDVECNLADASMSVLNDTFAMVLVVEAPKSLDEARLKHELSLITPRFDVLASVHAIERPRHKPANGSERVLIHVYGSDRPGIVHGVTSLIAASGSNIVDMRTQQSSGSRPLYSMILEVELAAGTNQDMMRSRLDGLAREYQVEVGIRTYSAAEL